jgi:hypothetical protein
MKSSYRCGSELPNWKLNSKPRADVNPRPPLPPFTEETARQKVQAAEDACNTRDPERIALAYTEDTEWRNRTEFLHGRALVGEFLRRNDAVRKLKNVPRRGERELSPPPAVLSCILELAATHQVITLPVQSPR